MPQRKLITHRTVERFGRAKYDFEALASKLRREGFNSAADACNRIANSCRYCEETIHAELNQRAQR